MTESPRVGDKRCRSCSPLCEAERELFAFESLHDNMNNLHRRLAGRIHAARAELSKVQASCAESLQDQASTFATRLEAARQEQEQDNEAWKEHTEQLQQENESKQNLIDCLQSELSSRNRAQELAQTQLVDTQRKLDDQLRVIHSLSTDVQRLEHEKAALEVALKRRDSHPAQCSRPTLGPLTQNTRSSPSLSKPTKRNPCFIITGFAPGVRQKLEQDIEKLGGTVVPCADASALPTCVTHIVAGSVTAKTVAGLLDSAITVVDAGALEDSLLAGEWCFDRGVCGSSEMWKTSFPQVTIPQDESQEEVRRVLEKYDVTVDQSGTPLRELLKAMKAKMEL